jgi:hypothetical protein
MDLVDIAEYDLVSAAAAVAIGIDGAGLRQRLRAGSIERVSRGWYAVWSPGAERPPWEAADVFDTARHRHRLLVTALLKSFDGRVVASHQSALVLHGIALWQADLDTAHVCRAAGDNTRHRRSAVIHPKVGAAPVRTPDGFLTVPVAHAVVQVGLYPPDDFARRTPMDGLIAADFALHHGKLTAAELEDAVSAHAHQAGISAIRSLLVHADGWHESPGETRLGHSLRRLGYRFTPQVPLPGGYFGDFGLDDDPVVIQFRRTRQVRPGHGSRPRRHGAGPSPEPRGREAARRGRTDQVGSRVRQVHLVRGGQPPADPQPGRGRTRPCPKHRATASLSGPHGIPARVPARRRSATAQHKFREGGHVRTCPPSRNLC